MFYRKEMIFILGSHCAGKTRFLTKYGKNFSCRTLLGDSFATPTELDKVNMLKDFYEAISGYVVEGQRFFRGRIYETIISESTKHKDVLTRVIFVYLTPKEMLRRIKHLRKKEPSAYMKEKAMYEAQTRFKSKLGTLRGHENIMIHEICVDEFRAWPKSVLPLIKYYPLW